MARDGQPRGLKPVIFLSFVLAGVLIAMVGALALSRVMTDKRRSDSLLKSVRDFVRAMQRPAAGKA